MVELEVSQIGKRATIGVLALTSRTAILQLVGFIATFALTILLTPEIFGVFFIVSAAVGFLNYFSDIGLAAALVQKKGRVTATELKTTFTIQQILVGLLVIISFLFANRIGQFYGLKKEGLILFKALVISFFLSSLKTIPSVLLERKLKFDKLVIPQIVETVAFYSIAVLLAFLGWGITSFTVAVLVRGLSGLLVMYLVAPWQPGFALDFTVGRRLLSFGVPFQLNSILALLKDDLFTLYLGKVLPFAQVGYIGWAKKWAEVPLRLLMDNIIRVTFPAYSRLQHDPILLRKAVEKALFFLGLLVFPLTLGLIFLIKPLVFLIPRYGKWEPALMSFYLFSLSAMLSTITSPLINLLNSIGKVKITLIFMVFWTVLTWTIIPLLLPVYGFNSVAGGILLISSSVVLVVLVAKYYVKFSLLRSFSKPILATTPLFLFLILVWRLPVGLIEKLILYTFVGGFIWLTTVFVIVRDDIVAVWQKLRHES